MEIKTNKFNWGIMGGDMYLWVGIPTNQKQATEDFINGLDEKYYTVKITQFRQKRSLDSNAYCWSLINEMANVLRTSKEEVYLTMLKRYGQSSVVSVIDEAVETFMKSVKYAEEFGKGTINGKSFTHIKVYMGSSEFDTRQMAIFIDGIISECKELLIEYLTPTEIERMKNEWGNVK